MGENIQISDKGETKVAFGADDFDDVDLLSADEKAALAEDVDLDGPDAKASEEDSESRQQRSDAAAKTAEDAAAKAADEAKATKETKATEDAAAKEAEDAKAAEDDAKAKIAEDEKKAKDAQDAEDEKKGEPAKIVPETSPPIVMAGLNEEQLKAVKDGLEDAKKQFQEGAIDYDEYLDMRDSFNQQLWSHDMAVQMSSESVDSRWEWEQETFLTDKANDWISSDDVVYPAFAATVNRIMSTEEGSVMPGPQLLEMAREEVAARFSPARQEERIIDDEEQKKQDALDRAKAAEANKAPPETLGGLPTAEIDEGVGEFDWLDKLDGEAYEKAVSNLSEAQQKRYEASI